MSKKTSCLCFIAVAVVAALVVRADAGEPTGTARPLKCVYFSPSDCEPNPDRAERRTFHAVGDGTFVADGEKFDLRKEMASKLPPL